MTQLDHTFRFFFDQNPLPIFVYDPVTFYFLAANQAATRMYGYNNDEFLKMTMFDLCPAAEHSLLCKSLDQKMIPAKCGPLQHFCKNGEKLFVNTYGSDIQIEERPARIVTIEVITKEADENLRKSENQFRTLAEALPQLIWIADYQGKPLYYNRRFYEYTGLSPAEATIAGVFRHLHKEDIKFCNHQWDQAVATGSPFEAHCRLLAARTNSYRWHVVRAVPLKNEAGKAVQWFGSWTDIHEQKESETNQRLLADISDTLNSSLDFETTLRNLARLALHHFADFVSVYLVEGTNSIRRVFALHADPAKEPLVREIEKFSPDLNSAHDVSRVILTGQAKFVTHAESCTTHSLGMGPEYQELLGQLNPKSYMIVPLTARGHNLGAITFISTKPTRRYTEVDLQVAKEMARKAAMAVENARLYQQSQQAIQVREDVLGVISHDLKNPVAALQLGTQVLQQFLSGDQIQEQKGRILKVLDRMEHSAVRATRLIHDILDMAKLASGHVVLEKCYFNASDIIIDSIEMLQPLAAQKGVEIVAPLKNQTCILHCDKERLMQVLSNLLGNALKFTPPGGRITVQLQLLDQCIRIAVTDTGSGILESDIPHIFDRFWQSKRTRKHGAGLGLSIVKGIMDAHGGQVWVESELGKGSTFYITLPRVQTPALKLAQ